MHEARIASDVGSQYRRQPALGPDWSPLHHRPRNPTLTGLYDGSDGMPIRADVGYCRFADMVVSAVDDRFWG
jgi:hypothetical protein